MGMMDFMNSIVFIVYFFAQYGLLGFIIYLVLVYGCLLGIGVYLKSKKFFEIWLLKLMFGFIIGFIYFWACFMAVSMISVIDFTATSGEILTLGVIIVLLSGTIFGIVGRIAVGITGTITEWIVGGTIAWISILLILFSLKGDETIAVIISNIIGIIIIFGFEGWISGYIAGIGMRLIVSRRYNKALDYLKNGDMNNCLKYLNKALYFLKWNEDSNKEESCPGNEFTNKIISLKNNLEQIQKAHNYCNLGKYGEALELYKKIVNENPELNDIIGDNLKHVKLNFENQFKRETQKVDRLFNENKTDKALEECERLLNEYPMFKNKIIPKIRKCKRKLKSEFIERLQKADSLFKNNEMEKALNEYEKLLNLLSGRYQKISRDYKKIIKDKIEECRLELFLERARKYELEAWNKHNKNDILKSIELWKKAVDQYKGGLNIAKIKGFHNYASKIKSKISKLLTKILDAEIKLLEKELR